MFANGAWIGRRTFFSCKVEEKEGVRLTISGTLSLITADSVRFSPSENGISTHLIFIDGWIASYSLILAVMYGSKSLSCSVQNSSVVFVGRVEHPQTVKANKIRHIKMGFFKFSPLSYIDNTIIQTLRDCCNELV